MSKKYKNKTVDFVPIGSKLTFIKLTRSPFSIKGKVIDHRWALYKCECGNEKELRVNSVNTGSIKSCGCLMVNFKKANITHGMTEDPLYALWSRVKSRCYDKNSAAYYKYGGRGVVMCDEWLNNPLQFIEWAKNNGYKKGLQLDKDIIATNLGLEPLLYSPERCQFVTPTENANCRRNSHFIEYNGKKQTMKQWSDELGVNRKSLSDRIMRYGWSVEDAFSTPFRKKIIVKNK